MRLHLSMQVAGMGGSRAAQALEQAPPHIKALGFGNPCLTWLCQKRYCRPQKGPLAWKRLRHSE